MTARKRWPDRHRPKRCGHAETRAKLTAIRPNPRQPTNPSVPDVRHHDDRCSPHPRQRPAHARRARGSARPDRVEESRAHRARLAGHPRRDRDGRGLAQPAHLHPGRDADRFAPARSGDPDARRRARLPLTRRGAECRPQPMAVRVSDFRRHAGLPHLSSRAPRAHPAGGRPRSGALRAVPDHPGELSAQACSRHHRPDRIPAEEGAVSECPGRSRLAVGAPAAPASREAWTAARRQFGAADRIVGGGRLVGVSAALARSAVDLDDGHHAHPQHRRARGVA